MSKTLFLVRHASAMERQTGQGDTDRELNSVGLQNATRMGINLSHQNIKFEIIISSPAIRAYATAGLIAEQLKYDTARIHTNPEIYEASARTLLQVINQLKDEWNTVMLIGHNPAISYLAEYITKDEIGDMTTCGVTRIEFDFNQWDMVSEGNGELISYEYPGLLNF